MESTRTLAEGSHCNSLYIEICLLSSGPLPSSNSLDEKYKTLNSASLGLGWIKLHPESVNIPTNITTMSKLKPGLPPATMNNQNNVGIAFTAPNWSGEDTYRESDKRVSPRTHNKDYVVMH